LRPSGNQTWCFAACQTTLNTTNSLVQKLWNYCNVLRDDLFDHCHHLLEKLGQEKGTLEAALEQFRLIAADLQT
jgi:hypothetical protein